MPFPKFKTKEEVPEAFREEYEEKEGEWVPKVAEPLGDGGLSALEKERAERKKEKKRADDAVAEAARLKQEADAKEKGISTEELKKIRDAEELARKPLTDENAALKAENRRLKFTDRVSRMFLEAGGIPDRQEDAMLSLEKRTELTDDGSDIVVKDKDNKPTTETIKDFLSKTFRKEKPWLYHGSNAEGPGGGSTGDDDAGTVTPVATKTTDDERYVRVRGAF